MKVRENNLVAKLNSLEAKFQRSPDCKESLSFSVPLGVAIVFYRECLKRRVSVSALGNKLLTAFASDPEVQVSTTDTNNSPNTKSVYARLLKSLSDAYGMKADEVVRFLVIKYAEAALAETTELHKRLESSTGTEGGTEEVGKKGV